MRNNLYKTKTRSVETPPIILDFIFSQEKLRSIASYLNLVPPTEREKDENWYRLDIDFLRELLVSVQKKIVERFYTIKVDLNSESARFNFRYRDTSVGRHSLKN